MRAGHGDDTIANFMGAKGDCDFRISDIVKDSVGTDI